MENKKLDDAQLKKLDKMFNLYEMEGILGIFVQKEENEQKEKCDDFVFNGGQYDDYSDR